MSCLKCIELLKAIMKYFCPLRPNPVFPRMGQQLTVIETLKASVEDD